MSNSAVQISENTQVSELDVTISKITFGIAPIYTSGVIRAARLLARDAGFDLQGFLIDVMSKRLARALDSAAVTIALAASWTNATTTAANTAITYTDLANLVFSIDPAYLASPSCGWVVSPTIALKLKTTLDSSNLLRDAQAGLESSRRSGPDCSPPPLWPAESTRPARSSRSRRRSTCRCEDVAGVGAVPWPLSLEASDAGRRDPELVDEQALERVTDGAALVIEAAVGHAGASRVDVRLRVEADPLTLSGTR